MIAILVETCREIFYKVKVYVIRETLKVNNL
jgi:hypothetical protein